MEMRACLPCRCVISWTPARRRSNGATGSASSTGRLARSRARACRAQGWVTGDNQPYSGHLQGDSIDTHALAHRRPNLLIEVRNDLIRTLEGQGEWAGRLAPVLERVLSDSGL